MSGASSLLKYRYQRKSSVSTLGQSAQSSPASTSSANHTQDSVGEDLSTSPIFPCRQQSVTSAATTSASAYKLQDASHSSSSASPWLSKERGISNGKSAAQSGRIRKAVVDDDSDDETDTQTTSSSSVSVQSNERDLQAKVSQLETMFPNISRGLLEEALNFSNGDFEGAVDHIMQQQASLEKAKEKRKKRLAFYQSSIVVSPESSPYYPPVLNRETDGDARYKKSINSPPKLRKESAALLSSPDSSPCVPPPVKKAKPLSFSDESPSSSQTSTASAAKPDVVDFKAVQQRVQFLAEAFPEIPRQELERILRENKFDVEDSTIALASYKPPEPVSQTKNVGSIKAMFASRAQAKAVNNHFLPGDNVEKSANSHQSLLNNCESDEEVHIEEAEKVKAPTAPVLEFFNVATVDELTMMNGCSRKKAEVIIKMRPFDDWDELVEKIHSNNSIPLYLIQEGREVIRLRSTLQGLMERCSHISSELETFISDLASQKSVDSLDTSRSYVLKQPALLTSSMTLAPYQMVGLNWLLLMHSHSLNGILGDEMGLGKTIETIAFFAQLLADGVKGPHLIIVPSSTIDNWLRELRTWCPALEVLLYYGSQEERRGIRTDLLDGKMDDFQILLTTYNMATGSLDDRLLFKRMKFHYAVFDEGHMLKNMTSARYKGLARIQARRRLLLTGTPLQNNLIELMSLLVFLMPDLFVDKTDILKRIFTSFGGNGDGRGTYEEETIAHAKQILKPFFLRRLKSEVLQQLPKKETAVMRVPMSFEQQDLYDELLAELANDVENETSGRELKGASVMMALRKAANHHLLHRRQFDDSKLKYMAELLVEEPTHKEARVDYVLEDMQVMSDFELHKLCLKYEVLSPFQLDTDQITDSGKFRHLDELLPLMKNRGDRVLLFSQFTMMLDIVEEFMSSRQYRYLRLDGSTPVIERQDMIDQFNTDTSIFVFLLSTKAGGLGINLTAANVVILHDIDFNPYNDKQAEDRCHRIGQKRDVKIYRLISKNSIEEAILRCAEKKLKLEMDVTGSGQKAGCDDISTADVASLLRETIQIGHSPSK